MSKRLKKLKKSGPHTAQVTSFSHEGRGICQIEGKTTFICGALPGETVSFDYKSCRNRYDEGDINTVITASPERVEPKCPHFGTCGGCQLQHISHDKQIVHKKKTFHELLQHHANETLENWLPTLQAEPWGYRRKARLSVKQVDGKGDLLIGFRERRSRYVADMRQCEVLVPEVGQHIDWLRQQLSALEGKRHVAQIEVCASGNETALIIRHLEPLSESDLNQLIEICKQRQYKLYLQPGGYDSVHLVYPADGRFLMQYELPKFDLRFAFHPSGFIQVNDTINQSMVERAIDLLDIQSSDRVLDLFCGIGNFSLAAAKQAAHVTGVEGDELAIELAKQNASINQLSNTHFYQGNLFEVDPHAAWLNQQYNKLILDPPRSGCKEIIPQLSTWKPGKIVYISCNPMTFARDVGLMKQLGYQLDQAGIMDMFPHTEHMEVMGVLTQAD